MPELTDQAIADAGWDSRELLTLGPIVRAVDLTHPDHPRIHVEVYVLSVAPHFRARLLIDKRETATIRNAGDLLALLRDPASAIVA